MFMLRRTATAAFIRLRRHGVETKGTPRIATEDAFESQPGTTERSVHLDGLERVFGTGRIIPAKAVRAEESSQHRRDQPAIQPDDTHQDVLQYPHQDSFSNSARRRTVR